MLSAQAQLVVWRLNARRCNVLFLVQEIAYNVAEATKTLNLNDSRLSKDPGDVAFFGCFTGPIEITVCRYTVLLSPSSDGSPVGYEVLDLDHDPRFSELPYIAGEPFIKYCYGIPLRTPSGFAIGSLCILDDKVRPPMSLGEKKCKWETTHHMHKTCAYNVASPQHNSEKHHALSRAAT